MKIIRSYLIRKDILRSLRLSKFSFSTHTKDATPVNVGDFRLEKSEKRPGKEMFSSSLVNDTLKDMEADEEFKITAGNLKKLGQKRLTLEERKKRRRALDDMGVPAFHEFLEQQQPNAIKLTRLEPKILQLNIGLYCNQACNHCHVESSPKRTEMMNMEVAKRCIELLDKTPGITTLDLTGGAPELNSTFRYLVLEGRKRGLEVIDRCNLTVLVEPGQEDLVDFLKDNQVRVVASLPCYTAENVNTQRGKGVFGRSIEGLLRLNDAGYGSDEGRAKGLFLDLVYNPGGAFLPPAQGELEEQYKEKLETDFGITFDSLFTITNMPIKRFADFLYRRGELTEYMELLVRNFNPAAVDGVMCRETVSVGWDGQLYDCDFNQQLAMPLGMALPDLPACGSGSGIASVNGGESGGLDIFQIDTLNLTSTHITMDHHCFGCTAGAGSSCQGATI